MKTILVFMNEESTLLIYFFFSLVSSIPMRIHGFFVLLFNRYLGPTKSSDEGMKRKTIVALNFR